VGRRWAWRPTVYRRGEASQTGERVTMDLKRISFWDTIYAVEVDEMLEHVDA
jgi:hypothetical protein